MNEEHRNAAPTTAPRSPREPSADTGDREPYVRVWRLHPGGVRVEAADRTLQGDAPSGAVRWCGPFTHANGYGFWLYSPVDIDIVWHGGRSFEYELLGGYGAEDYAFVKQLQSPADKYQYAPRTKLDPGRVFEGIFSVWTGCAFQTPPGWALMMRSPINKATSPVLKVQEGILETDWLAYDIWMNLQFVQQSRRVSLRRDGWPVAQIIPVRREGYDRRWQLIDGPFERETPEGEAFYQRWIDYNHKKWVEKTRKEPYTYHSERARYLKRSERDG